jgi:hypothetical protein
MELSGPSIPVELFDGRPTKFFDPQLSHPLCVSSADTLN